MAHISTAALQARINSLKADEEMYGKAWLFWWKRGEYLVLSHETRDIHRSISDRHWASLKAARADLRKAQALLRARQPRNTFAAA